MLNFEVETEEGSEALESKLELLLREEDLKELVTEGCPFFLLKNFIASAYIEFDLSMVDLTLEVVGFRGF